MFNFATINVYFRFSDIVFLLIWCENKMSFFLVLNESLLVLNQADNLSS